jgi:outer membrane protein insertion porin family
MTWEKKIFICILLFISYFFPSVLARASDSGKIIRAIEVKGLTRIDEAELVDIICFRVGDTLDEQDLRAGVKRSFKKGIFYNIQVISAPYEGGVKLTYLVKEIPVINKIIVEGNEKFSQRRIKKMIPLKKGEDFKERLLNKAQNTLLEFYQRKGFPETRVNIVVEDTKKPASVNIVVNIVEGQALLVKNVIVPEDVRYLISIGSGDIYDRDKVDKNIRNLKNHFKKKNYISPVIGPYTFAKGELTIPVQNGPRLEVIFKNNSAVSTRKLKKEVPFMDSGEVSDELVSETVDRIRKLYASKGYYYAQVDYTVKRDEDIISVTFTISEGEKVLLREVAFTGISVNPEAVKKAILLKENKPYDDELLSSSEESLVDYYNALGYLQMEIVEIKKEFQNDGREIFIEFFIHEGTQTMIESIRIDGNEKITSSEIREILKLSEGLPYNEIDVADARHRVLSFYANQGYLSAHVEVKSMIDDNKAVVAFRIKENKPFVIGKIILRGNERTKAKIIKREYTFEEGERYSHQELTNVKQRLYKLGIFNEVSIDILESNEEGDTEFVRDMLVSVKEANAGSVEVGVGYGDYERFRGGFDISYRNLGGYNRQIGFRTELSTVEQKYVFNFKEPWFLNKPDVALNLFLLKEKTRSVNADTRSTRYKIDRLSFIAGVGKQLTESLKVGMGYEYSSIDTTDVDPGVVLSRDDVGTIDISAIIPSLFYDTRDDLFDATSGSVNRVVLKYASDLLLSEAEFIKGTFKSSWFFPIMKRFVFAVSFGGGAANGLGGTEELPLVERFFLGGGTTVRGYEQDTLGPKGEDDSPTGGNVFVLTNWEMRLPLGKGFGLVPFVDAGNVWQTLDDFDAELKYTVGAGLRYKTPVGPVRVDYGYKLNRDSGESTGEVHFSFGHAF